MSPLANNSLAVQDAIKKDEFMMALVGEMKRAEGGDQNFKKSRFSTLYNQNELITQSSKSSAEHNIPNVKESKGHREKKF